MKTFAEILGLILAFNGWLAGIVIANGFWLTALSICFPPYAWYLVVERAMLLSGVI